MKSNPFDTAEKIARFLDEQQIIPADFLSALPLVFAVSLAGVNEEDAEIVIDEIATATKIIHRKYTTRRKEINNE